MGGTIRVESEPGEFTEMIIDLPKEPPPVSEGEEGEESASLRIAIYRGSPRLANEQGLC